MNKNRIVKAAGLFYLSAVLSGCASVYQSHQFGSFEKELATGEVSSAAEKAIKHASVDEATGKPTELLWSLQAGSLLRMEKEYSKSNVFFDASEDMMYSSDTQNTGVKALSEGGSILVNDAILPYSQTHYDGIMANTYKALNFQALHKNALARVEWNRVDDRQRRAVDDFAAQISKRRDELEAEKTENKEDSSNLGESLSRSKSLLGEKGVDMSQWQPYKGYVNPYATYMHGLFFMLNGKDRSDFERAYHSFQRAYSMTSNPTAKADMDVARQLRDGFPPKRVRPRVWVIFENGLAANKKEFRIDLPIVLSSEDIVYTGIALPKIQERNRAWDSISVNGTKTHVIGDMDRIIKAEFKEEFPYILGKEIVRATAKTIAQRNMGKQNANAGLVMAIYQMATTSADIRSWTALPKEFQVARIQRPENGVVSLSMPGKPEPVVVPIDKSSQYNIVYVKAVSSEAHPIIEVISL